MLGAAWHMAYASLFKITLLICAYVEESRCVK